MDAEHRVIVRRTLLASIIFALAMFTVAVNGANPLSAAGVPAAPPAEISTVT